MRALTAVLSSLLLCTGTAFAQGWSATFVPEKGNRIDYIEKKGGFKHSVDDTSYRFEFIVPEAGDTARMRLIPTEKNTDPSEDYRAFIAHRSGDMIILIVALANNPDKFEVYTLYPRAGVGFITTTSAYLGNSLIKELSLVKPEIPTASASIFPLRQISPTSRREK